MSSRILSFMIPNTFFSREFKWKKHLSGHSTRNSWTSGLCVCVCFLMDPVDLQLFVIPGHTVY